MKKVSLRRAAFAGTLNEQVDLVCPVTFWKLYRRDFNIQAVRLAALDAFEMDMVVMMAGSRAGVVAKGVFQAAFVVQDFVDEAPVEEGF